VGNKKQATMIKWILENKRDVIEGAIFFSILTPFLYGILLLGETLGL